MPGNKSKERQTQIKRHSDMAIATIDYIIQQVATESLPQDAFGDVAGYYQQQKEQIERYSQMGRLSVLQRRLTKLTEFPMRRGDVTFNDLIKEKTGYKIDIFENLRIRIEGIIGQNQITNEKELSEVFIMLEVYKQEVAGAEKPEILRALLVKYAHRKQQVKISK